MSACESTDAKLERLEQRMAELELEVSNLKREDQRSQAAAPAPFSEAEGWRQSGKIKIKVAFMDDVRLLTINARATVKRISSLIEETFDLEEYLNYDYELVIQYRDADGDLMTLTSKADLDHAMEVSPIPKLMISRKKL